VVEIIFKVPNSRSELGATSASDWRIDETRGQEFLMGIL
jgi:hypothetical protein